MYLLIRNLAGVIVEGIVLASGRNRMRVAAAGFADTIELNRSGANWMAAGSEPIELEFIMARSCETRGVRAVAFAGAN